MTEIRWEPAETFEGMTAKVGEYILHAAAGGWSVAGPGFYTSGRVRMGVYEAKHEALKEYRRRRVHAISG